ncbi:hypothetical protein FH063_006290 [Azospirillum argentinense]|uniref:Uncharacterized protein n=1 Tax=Azospirillum argentinense TaxID=2970906 RepID=A0A5B0KVQ8_9PROT|nr:hypothetical protein FH063_006290 [Azospirillum argentinense]
MTGQAEAITKRTLTIKNMECPECVPLTLFLESVTAFFLPAP